MEEEIDFSTLFETYKKEKDKLSLIQCYLAKTPPKFEDCKQYFKESKINITREEYQKACKKSGF